MRCKYSLGRDQGLSVVELAVTICIIGIGLTFALKGSVAVEAIRATIMAFELRQYQETTTRYIDQFRAFPGDDPLAPRRWGRAASLNRTSSGEVASFAGDFRLNGRFFASNDSAGEQFAAWRDFRYAGFVPGDPKLEGISAMPENPFGGFYGFDEGNLGHKVASLCATRVPGNAAASIDRKLDDGRIDTGILRGTARFSIEDDNHFDTPDNEPYDIEKEYIICVPMLP